MDVTIDIYSSKYSHLLGMKFISIGEVITLLW